MSNKPSTLRTLREHGHSANGVPPLTGATIPEESVVTLEAAAEDTWVGASHELRLAVQRQAKSRLCRHGAHDALRILALFVVDLVAVMVVHAIAQMPMAIEGFSCITYVFPPRYVGGIRFVFPVVVSLILLGAYQGGDGWRSPWLWLKGVTLATALTLWQSIWDQGALALAAQFVGTVVTVVPIVALGRTLLAIVVAQWRKRVGWIRRAVLVGDRASISRASRSRVFRDAAGYRVSGTVAVDEATGAGGVWLSLAKSILEADAHAVFITSSLATKAFRQTVEVANNAGCELVSVSRALDVGGMGHSGRWYRGVPLTILTRPGLKAHQLAIKRLLDVALAGIGLVVLAPVIICVAVAVKVTSPGPVLFRQSRVGLGGKRFDILKFRSMRKDAESRLGELSEQSIYDDPRLFKVQRDPRVTPLGRWLRRSSLDELPQLLNVLRGDMSLVGPRPPIPAEVDLYESHHLCRFDVRPGITGPWQVAGRNLIRDFEQVVLLERAYICEWSLATDLRILLRTLPVVIKGTGAH